MGWSGDRTTATCIRHTHPLSEGVGGESRPYFVLSHAGYDSGPKVGDGSVGDCHRASDEFDLVKRLDRSGRFHRELGRTHSEASLLQGEEAGGVEAIDADRFTVNAQLLEEFDDLGGDRCGAGRASRADVRPASFLLSALPWRNGLQDRPVRAGTPTGRVCPEQGPRRICPSRVTTTRS